MTERNEIIIIDFIKHHGREKAHVFRLMGLAMSMLLGQETYFEKN